MRTPHPPKSASLRRIVSKFSSYSEGHHSATPQILSKHRLVHKSIHHTIHIKENQNQTKSHTPQISLSIHNIATHSGQEAIKVPEFNPEFKNLTFLSSSKNKIILIYYPNEFFTSLSISNLQVGCFEKLKGRNKKT